MRLPGCGNFKHNTILTANLKQKEKVPKNRRNSTENTLVGKDVGRRKGLSRIATSHPQIPAAAHKPRTSFALVEVLNPRRDLNDDDIEKGNNQDLCIKKLEDRAKVVCGKNAGVNAE